MYHKTESKRGLCQVLGEGMVTIELSLTMLSLSIGMAAGSYKDSDSRLLMNPSSSDNAEIASSYFSLDINLGLILRFSNGWTLCSRIVANRAR